MKNKRHILLENRKSINGLEISKNLGLMNWNDSFESVKKLGKGWRLPTVEELHTLLNSKEGLKQFSKRNCAYWSSEESTKNFYYYVHLHKNKRSYYTSARKSAFISVHAVRYC